MSLEISPTTFSSHGRIAILSPHLDDAVLSCGALIARSPDATVITLFAGIPAKPSLSTEWDRECGFASAEHAVNARREEDRLAIAKLGATSKHLDCFDGQYLDTLSSIEAVDGDDARNAAALSHALRAVAPDLILVPLGLFHSDHIRARRAWMRCALAYPDKTVRWVAYEDVPYRLIGAALQSALAALHGAGFAATPAHGGDDGPAFERKLEALHAYDSQLASLGAATLNDAHAPERFWSITPSHVDACQASRDQ